MQYLVQQLYCCCVTLAAGTAVFVQSSKGVSQRMHPNGEW